MPGKPELGSHEAAHIDAVPDKDKTAATADGDAATFETLGVTEEQFAKFFNTETREYNWQGHAKETEFKLAQKAGKGDAKAAGGDDTKSADKADTKSADKAADDAKADSGDDAKSAVAAAGLDFDELGDKIRDAGDIEDADYAALEKIGIPRHEIEAYISFVKTSAEQHTNAVIGAFGGEQGYTALQTWVKDNLTADEVAGYEDMLNSPQWRVAVDALRTRMKLPPAETGKAVETPNANTSKDASATGFKTQTELNAAIRDPKYKTDPAYRAEVAKKAAASTFQSNPRFHTSGI